MGRCVGSYVIDFCKNGLLSVETCSFYCYKNCFSINQVVLDCLFLTEKQQLYTQRNVKHEDSSYARFPFRVFPLVENLWLSDIKSHLYEGLTLPIVMNEQILWKISEIETVVNTDVLRVCKLTFWCRNYFFNFSTPCI